MAKQNMNSRAHAVPAKFDPVEGMFYERVFSPETVKVQQNSEGNVSLLLTDRNGHKLEVIGRRLVRYVCKLLRPWTGFKLVSELYGQREDPKKFERTLQIAIDRSKRNVKCYFNGNGALVGVASEIHKQISWAHVRELIERAVKKSFGIAAMPKGEGAAEQPNKWTYRMPLKNENVSAWVTVSAGNNLIRGKSGIRVWSRFRTEKGGLKRPACLNWCGMWTVPLQFFGLKTERLDEIPNIELLNMQEFHLTNAIEKDQEFEQQLVAKMKGMEKILAKGILPLINQSRKVPLAKAEMEAILDSYQEKVALPKYIVKQILEHVEELTVWGFSQAVSWVRTHGSFQDKRAKLPKEERSLIQILENISGEVLSLTPTIKKLHEVLKQRRITKTVLTTPQKYQELKPMIAR